MRALTLVLSVSEPAAEFRRIQVLRGLGCLLVVLMHVIGTRPIGGMRVADDSAWRELANLLLH